MFLFGLSLYGAMLLLPLYYQQLRGTSALAAGLLLAPQGVGSLLPRLAIGSLTDRFGPRLVVLASTLVAALGTLPFALATAHTSEILLSAALVVRGAGLGGATIAVMAAAYEGLEPGQVPHASSATRIMQQVGGAFGASVLAVILAGLAAAHPGALGLASAFRGTFWWCLAFTALALGPALLLSGARRRGDRADQVVARVGPAAEAPAPVRRVEDVHPDVLPVVPGHRQRGHDVGGRRDERRARLHRGQPDAGQLELDQDQRPVRPARVDVFRRQDVHRPAHDRGEEAVPREPADLDQRRGQPRQDLALPGRGEHAARGGNGDRHGDLLAV